MRGVTMALCALSIVSSAQENPLTWFPLQVGSRWVYEHEWKSGDRNGPAVDHWSTEEIVTGWATIPEGIVVLRDAKERVDPGGQSGWDSQKQDLRPEFRKYLSDGSVSPDFCFPLETGREWGNNDIPWRVEPAR